MPERGTNRTSRRPGPSPDFVCAVAPPAVSSIADAPPGRPTRFVAARSPGRAVSVVRSPIHLPNPEAAMPSTQSRPQGQRWAFTLIELLVVIAIIAVLIGL